MRGRGGSVVGTGWLGALVFCCSFLFFGVVSVCMFLCLLPCRGVLCFCGGCFGGVVGGVWSVLGAFLGFWGWFLPVFGVVFWYNGFGWFFGYLAMCGK